MTMPDPTRYYDCDGPDYGELVVDSFGNECVSLDVSEGGHVDLNREAVLLLIDQLDDWVARTTPPWNRHITQ